MQEFLRIHNDHITQHYITAIKNGLVFYGHHVPGHENRQPTAVMTAAYYRRLWANKQIIGKEATA